MIPAGNKLRQQLWWRFASSVSFFLRREDASYLAVAVRLASLLFRLDWQPGGLPSPWGVFLL